MSDLRGPDFMIVGPMKSGSSTIWHNMLDHPKMFAGHGWKNEGDKCSDIENADALIKEYHYYDGFGHRHVDDYKRIWSANKDPSVLNYESTPSYLGNTYCLTKLLCDFRNIKMLITLRNPTERFISHYKHFRMVHEVSNDSDIISKIRTKHGEDFHMKHKDEIEYIKNQKAGLEPNTLEQILEKHRKNKWYGDLRGKEINYFMEGEYITQIKNIISLIGIERFRENVLLKKFSDLSGNHDMKISFYNSIFDFLNIERLPVVNFKFRREWIEYKKTSPNVIWANLKLQGQDWNSLLYNADHEVKEEHIEYLNNHYRPYNDLLNDFVGEEIF